jgi:hypothetical protein
MNKVEYHSGCTQLPVYSLANFSLGSIALLVWRCTLRVQSRFAPTLPIFLRPQKLTTIVKRHSAKQYQ